MLADGLQNVMSGLGLSGDKAAQAAYASVGIGKEQLLACYKSSWVAQKAIDLPVDDATRHWREWQGDEAIVDVVDKIEARIKLRETVASAVKRARLYGGAVIFIGTDRQTITAPMQPNERIRFLSVVDSEDVQITFDDDNPLVQPQSVIMVKRQPVHESRLIVFRGRYSPDQPIFGISEIAASYECMRAADSVAANIASMIYEAKLDVYSIPNLMSQDEADLMKRLLLAQRGKSVLNAIVLDAEETYEQKELGFGGLREILMASYQLVAGATGIPASKLLGTPISGLAATGDNEIRDYYDVVASVQRNQIEPAIKTIDKLMLAEAGTDPTQCWPEWKSLWQESENEKAERNSKNAATLQTLANIQVLTDEQIESAARSLMGDLIPQDEITEVSSDVL